MLATVLPTINGRLIFCAIDVCKFIPTHSELLILETDNNPNPNIIGIPTIID